MLQERFWRFAGLGALLLSCSGCSSDDAGGSGSPNGSGGSGATGNGGSSGGATPSGGSAGSASAGGSAGSGAGGSAGSGATGGSSGGGGSGGTGTNGGTGSEGIRWVGRVDASDPAVVNFAWQGAGFVANVSGPTVTVKLQVNGSSTVYFQPVVDGVAGERFNVDPGAAVDVTLATGLSDADHSIELYRETEGAYGVSSFLGFTEGTLTTTPPANERLIEVVGDSISAGYGNLGSEPHPNWVANPACHWTAENSSWYLTYAALAGRALGAEVSTVARSGWGMSRDIDGGSNVLANVYENALGTDDPAPWHFERKPSVVVINLGTNDWAKGDPGTDYETDYAAFIATIRGHYPDAFIFLTIGSMLGEPELTEAKTRLASVVAAVSGATGDDKLVTFDFGTQNLGSDGSIPSGCDWHPSRDDHARMAGILEQQLGSKLGW
jgi:lysophospholipase L1-like esterase